MEEDFKKTQTYQNLMDAFSQESRANRLYLYFSRRAMLEGYPEIAETFLEAAQGETGHALGILDYLREYGEPTTGKPIGTTTENLEAALALEALEHNKMYPEMARQAREEGHEEIAEWFESLARAEDTHAAQFRQALEKLKKK
ncbi:MAG TPA: rubrerythrin [Planctomycetes bacterium]|nr:rubrerythrin [Planctomycetota bacterium]